MPSQFLHGVEVIEIDSGPRPIQTVQSAVIGVVGTARDRVSPGRRNEPILIRGSIAEAEATFDGAGTLLPAIRAILDQTPALVVAVNCYDPASHFGPLTEAEDFTLETDSVLVAPGASGLVVKSQDGATTYTEGAANDYTFAAATGILTRTTTSGIAAGATVSVQCRFPDPAGTPAAALVGGTDAASGTWTGVEALRGAESSLGVRPRIVTAPGYCGETTGDGDTLAAPVGAALVSVAEKLRGIAVLDGPATTDAAAIAFRNLFGSRRAYIVDPDLMVWDGAAGAAAAQPPSARVAGVIARSDVERGFWWSPSNREIAGITGTSRPVDFVLGDATSRANHLNENEIATIIRAPGGGFRLWGNRSCSPDPKWAFLSVVRTADLLNDSLLRGHFWAVDRNLTTTYFEDVSESVNAYIRNLIGQGALLSGRCVPSEQNSPATRQAGQAFFDFEFEPPTPAERITFRSRLKAGEIEEVA